jgi:EAL domain-containing protein (putative c-di-GMP-specific phosphodiesterase class I)
MAGEIRVIVIDDHELLAESLVRLLGDDPALSVVGKAMTARDGIDLALSERPDVVIMDYKLPDMDGAAATTRLKAELPGVKVIMLTGSERPGAYTAGMEAGCSAWVRKTRAVHDLLDAVHRVALGERVGTDEYEELPPLGELVVHYQPILELVSRRVVGFEALVRWQHPTQGLLLPGRFLPLAEETGYITDIGRHVAGQAMHDLALWKQDDPPEPGLWVSVNMSAVGLSSRDIPHQVGLVLTENGLDPASLVVEITETALLEDTPEITENLRALKDLGVHLALDDFGTAFSSLSYLRRFPFDHVKIDNSFTAELPHTARAVLLIESILHLADSMGATGVAEGIEQPEQAECLIETGWPLGQGWLYSRAVPFEQASEMVRTGTLP